jgi:hypothetical protein
LHALAKRYEASNAMVVTGFDPSRQALIFEGDGDGYWLTPNFALPVAYSVNPNYPEGYLSYRLIDSTLCARVRGSRVLQAAFVHGLAFYQGEAIRDSRMEERFCNLSMPEKPELPNVIVRREEEGFRAKPTRYTDHNDDHHAGRSTIPTLGRQGRTNRLDTYAGHGMRPQFRSVKLGLQRRILAKRLYPHRLGHHPILPRSGSSRPSSGPQAHGDRGSRGKRQHDRTGEDRKDRGGDPGPPARESRRDDCRPGC